MTPDIQRTAMLLALGKPDFRTIGDAWYTEAHEWLEKQGVTTHGARRTIINDFTTWVRNTEKNHG